ncbi:immunoglobulin-like domain-containing protein, partial [Pseudomonas sp. BBP2017]|uniref:immunoglobulin-like domain-containing protein n=1 Tax=Pseudomonas sp. BBP2017 TaxID=2109731 RepID=UPI000D44ECCF
TLTVPASNGEDAYKDGTELTATITGVNGPGFEKLEVGNSSATSTVVDTTTVSTVSLTGSVQDEGPSAQYI